MKEGEYTMYKDIQQRPILGLTMGDPSGIGPEIIIKAWADPEIRQLARLVAIGDADCFQQALEITHLSGKIRAIQQVEEALFAEGTLDVLDLGNIAPGQITWGQVQPAAGKAAYEAVVKGAELALAGKIEALVTAPLNKEAMNLAGYHYDGHTGLLKELTGAPTVTMMLLVGDFRITHVSTHCSLRQAIERVKKARILQVLYLTHRALRDMGIARPRLAVAGLNPHAGEGGLFGQEEILEITPAIEQARQEGLAVHPTPLPADSIFYRMHALKEFDAVVAMYHDQGHIPAKLLGFSEGVNLTLGLPIIRTSVDHGTAFDKAGKGIADPTSLKRAIEVAVQLCQGRTSK